MKVTLIFGRDERHILSNQLLLLWDHLCGQCTPPFCQRDHMYAAILRVRPSLDETTTLQTVEQSDNVSFRYKQQIGQSLLRDVRKRLEMGQHRELRRCEVIVFQMSYKAFFYLKPDTVKMQPCPYTKNE